MLLANGALGARTARHLAALGDLEAVVVHPARRQRAMEDLVIDVPVWTWPVDAATFEAVEPEAILSVLFGYVVPPELLRVPSIGTYNLHPGFLPWNRGAAPNAWPLVDGSPAGVTLHVMDETIDTGPIVAQRRTEVRFDDTAATLYERLLGEAFELLRETWPSITSIVPTPQSPGGSYHRLSDLDSLGLREEDLPVLDRLRARTFPPHGAGLVHDGVRYRVTIQIEALPPE